MRKIFSIIVLLVASVTLFAQSDVTKFLGIPVDGFKPDMIRKLKEKGFVSIEYDKNIILEGEFNGVDVNVFVVTNNNKVYRIMVCDAKTISETDIRIRFNNLCRQFANNSKYTTPILASVDDYIISEDEDISYEMAVKNKRYEAIFYQKPDPIAQQKDFENYKKTISDAYTEEELKEIATRLQIPVVHTLMGTGTFPDNLPTSLGMMGMHGNYCANLTVANADVIFAITEKQLNNILQKNYYLKIIYIKNVTFL